MAILNWGKPNIEIATSTNMMAGTAFKVVDTPKEDSLDLTVEAGEKIEAKEEGGEVIDTRYKRGKATLKFQVFWKKGVELPLKGGAGNSLGLDGPIPGEYTIRVTPEDKTCDGFLIPRSSIMATTNYTAANGTLVTYECTILAPASGDRIQSYKASAEK